MLSGVDIMAESEIARLRRLIELECEAMERGLTGYAITAKHDIIAHRYDRIDAYRKQLVQITDEAQAAKIIAEIYMHTVG
jgi:transcriptional regulator of met regulon